MLKAYTNSDISLETTAIFFLANRNLNRVLTRFLSWLNSFAWDYSTYEDRKRKSQNKKNSCPQLDSNPDLSAYEAKCLSDALFDEISNEH